MKNKWEDSLSALSVGQQFAQKVKDDARKYKIRRYAPLILLIVMTIIGAISQKNFFSWGNIVNIMYQMSIPLVISTGLMYVLLLGSIDLSIEGVMGFAGSFVAFLVINNSNDNDFGLLGILLVVLISTAVGALTGFLHVRARIATFIVSYAGEAAVSGVSLVNSFSTIFIYLFTTLASGGAVVISQYIGRGAMCSTQWPSPCPGRSPTACGRREILSLPWSCPSPPPWADGWRSPFCSPWF